MSTELKCPICWQNTSSIGDNKDQCNNCGNIIDRTRDYYNNNNLYEPSKTSPYTQPTYIPCDLGVPDLGNYGKMGWICPVCGRGLSPNTTECPCYYTKRNTTITTNASLSEDSCELCDDNVDGVANTGLCIDKTLKS